MKTEPSMLIGAIAMVIETVLILLVSFGVTLTLEQRTAIIATANALLGLAAFFWVRSKVWSAASVEKMSSIPGTTTTIRPPAPPPEAA